jgi:hypothetical protein
MSQKSSQSTGLSSISQNVIKIENSKTSKPIKGKLRATIENSFILFALHYLYVINRLSKKLSLIVFNKMSAILIGEIFFPNSDALTFMKQY